MIVIFRVPPPSEGTVNVSKRMKYRVLLPSPWWVGETNEPAVDRILGRAGLAGDVWREGTDRARGAARHHTLKNGLELIETRAVDSGDL